MHGGSSTLLFFPLNGQHRSLTLAAEMLLGLLENNRLVDSETRKEGSHSCFPYPPLYPATMSDERLAIGLSLVARDYEQ